MTGITTFTVPHDGLIEVILGGRRKDSLSISAAHHPQLVELLAKDGVVQYPLHMLSEILNAAYIAGYRDAKQEIREALGFTNH